MEERARRKRSAKSAQLLEEGRASYEACDWVRASRLLRQVDAESRLHADDLERLALCAYLIGKEEEHVGILERAYRAHLEAERPSRAARCAFWIGLTLMFQGRTGAATGWLSRMQRALSDCDDCVEQGYLLIPRMQRHFSAREYEQALSLARRTGEIAERFGDRDLIALARHWEGRVRIWQGEAQQGLALFDEAMVAVTSGELSPRVTGLVYCAMILACQYVFAFDRAQEWTEALARWCDSQPTLVAYTGTCLVHRSEILQMHGSWMEAVQEAQQARVRLALSPDPRAQAPALYQQAEVLRLRGEFQRAEEMYEQVGLLGRDPQPGLALLRLAQGDTDRGVASIERTLATTIEPLFRAKFLGAAVEIQLAASAVDPAEERTCELEGIAARFGTPTLRAMADHARGATELARGDPRAALVSLRRAVEGWERAHAPYATARARVLMARACRALGDADGCKMEREAARAAFSQLGAAPDLRALEALEEHSMESSRTSTLSLRELEVLRLLASGETNKGIAARLSVSVRTVDRHVSNLFNKLGVSSRAAATAYAYEHGLL